MRTSGVAMRAQALAIGLAGALAATAAMARDVSIFVIPGKPGVPVMIDGVDASYCVIESEFGLGRPGLLPTIIVCPPAVPENARGGSYFPKRGKQPGYGRHEIEPPPDRPMPRTAPKFHREWSAESDPLPAQIDPPVMVPYSVDVGRRGRPQPYRRHYGTP
jgi:hypothetical protein